MSVRAACAWFLAAAAIVSQSPARAAVYDVGPAQPYTNIGDVPLESLVAGDTVRIHWRATPYKEKWVIGGVGTPAAPITFTGVPGTGGVLPEIDGDGAVTRTALDFWNEDRGIIKFGDASTPSAAPQYVIVENLDIHSARPAYGFTDDGGTPGVAYTGNAAAVYIAAGSNITVRNCIIRDSANGIFGAHSASDVLIENCYIYDNGMAASAFEHNNYTECDGITFQYNHFGPLRAGCDGNNLKDRSAGLVVRYNWIESGNRQLDLVDTDWLESEPDYSTAYVYGNVLVEHDGDGNSQIVHFGGDGGGVYRTQLYFHNNTIVSTRTGNTTLFRLSTNSVNCDARNNIFYVTNAANRLAMLDSTGQLSLSANFLKPGWVNSHSGLDPSASVTVASANIEAADPGFEDESGQNYRPAQASVCLDASAALAAGASGHPVSREYVKHRSGRVRPAVGARDLGALEYGTAPSGGGGGGGGGGGCLAGRARGWGIVPVLALMTILWVLRRRRALS